MVGIVHYYLLSLSHPYYSDSYFKEYSTRTIQSVR